MKIKAVMKKFNAALGFFSGSLLLALMVMTVIDVIMRRFFNSPLLGSFELTQLSLSMIVLTGFAYANDFKEHVVIDFIYDKTPRGFKRICAMLTVLLTILMTAVMCFVVFRQGIRLIDTGEITFSLRLPRYPVAMIGGIAFFGYFLSAICDFFHVFIEGKVLSDDAS
jgi:TRAP-type C4-dicarboxylate transport system permease small subunit